ncbi:MAG: MFS transporter, partial [Lachnospiraceae bacterium]|nr:MFS transporter [Lachnospiraceae bacterium]
MDQNKEKMLILLRCCLCIGGAVGMISNCIGIYYTPIAQSLGVGRGDVALMVTLTSLSTAFFGPVFVRLIRRFRINLVMSFGVLLGVGAYLLMSVAGTIYLFYVAGVIIGISASCFATLPVSLILKDWYKEKNGSMLGIAMAFSGAFAAILNP